MAGGRVFLEFCPRKKAKSRVLKVLGEGLRFRYRINHKQIFNFSMSVSHEVLTLPASPGAPINPGGPSGPGGPAGPIIPGGPAPPAGPGPPPGP